MTRRVATWMAAAIACVLALSIAASADAQRRRARGGLKRIVLEQFRGPLGGRLRSEIQEALAERSDEYEVIDASELGGRTQTDDDYLRIGRRQRVAVFISGSSSRGRRRRMSATVYVRVAPNFERQTLVTRGGTGGGAANVSGIFWQRMDRYLGSGSGGGSPSSVVEEPPPPRRRRAPPPPPDEEVEEEEPPPPPRRRRRAPPPPPPEYEEEEEEEEPPPRRRRRRDDEEDDPPPDDEEEEEEEDEDPPDDDEEEDEDDGAGPSPAQRQDWLDIAITLADVHRALDLQLVDEPEPRRYRTAAIGYSEIGIEAMGFVPSFPYIGLQLGFRHSLVVKTTGCKNLGAAVDPCPAMDLLEVGTASQEIMANLVGRYRIGDDRSGITLMGLIGYGQFEFSLDDEQTEQLNRGNVLETHTYGYVNLEARGRIPIDPTYFVGELALMYRLGIGTVGERAIQQFGEADGSGAFSGYGLRVGFRTELPFIVQGAYTGLRFDWYHFSTTFLGPGNAYRAEPPCLDDCVAPASDDFFRISLYLGFAMR